MKPRLLLKKQVFFIEKSLVAGEKRNFVAGGMEEEVGGEKKKERYGHGGTGSVQLIFTALRPLTSTAQ